MLHNYFIFNDLFLHFYTDLLLCSTISVYVFHDLV